LCEIDAEIAQTVKGAAPEERLRHLFISEMRYRNKFNKKHLDDLSRAQGSRRLQKMVRDRLVDRLQHVREDDGTQTPYVKHGIDVACHFCATCCRGCTFKWHGTPEDGRLSDDQISELVNLVLTFINRCLLESLPIRQVMTEHPRKDVRVERYYQPALILVEPKGALVPWNLLEFIPE